MDTNTGTDQAQSKLSVIVPAYNSARTLPDCLDALQEARNLTGTTEVIVVDDGSTDQTAAIASGYDVHLLRSPGNRGPGAARNLGAAHAQGDVLLFVDADVAVAGDALARIERHFDADASSVAVIGSYDSEPQGGGLVSSYRNLLHHFVHQQASRDASHFWTGLGAIRKPVFDALGGFDEKEFGRSIEDVELGYRMRAGGHAISMDRDILCKHLKHWTLASMVRTDLLTRAIPWTHLLIKYRHMPNDFSLGPTQKISVMMAGLFVLFASVTLVQPQFVLGALLACAGFIAINLSFFSFIAKREGVMMGIVSVPLHLLYNVTAGVGLVSGLGTLAVRWLVQRVSRAGAWDSSAR